MKIIEEIEKSRLTDENMAAIVGGVSIGENCSEKVKFTSCSSRFEICECATKISCTVSYYYSCTGPGKNDKNSCPGFWVVIKSK